MGVFCISQVIALAHNRDEGTVIPILHVRKLTAKLSSQGLRAVTGGQDSNPNYKGCQKKNVYEYAF